MLKKLQTLGRFKKLMLGCVGLSLHLAEGKGQFEDFRLKVYWGSAGSTQELKSWTLDELQQLKKVSSREKDPSTGKILKWDGVLLSQLLEKGMEGLLPEK